MIQIENLHYTYRNDSPNPVVALRNINLAIAPGEYMVIVGANGSGKSTLAKHLNALLTPTAGNVWVKGWNTRDLDHLIDIRSTVGMVFQTPDNQIVATIVEEDVAFGPENLGVPHAEIKQRVDWSLAQVDLLSLRGRAPHLLSGGQKQRVCIAGVLAMQPQVLVLDESTAMLDPHGRQEVLAIARRLNQEQGVTVVAITHFMHEAIAADRVIVMAGGEIVLQGAPRTIFGNATALRDLHLDVPQVTQLALALQSHWPDFPTDLLTVDEITQAIKQQIKKGRSGLSSALAPPTTPAKSKIQNPLISLRHLAHDYMRGTPLMVRALHDVNLTIYQGEIVGILGHTGSGKSTVIQHFNALLRPHAGDVTVLGQNLNDPNLYVRDIRRRVGLVFQFPEAQLFEQFVGDDIAYGPRNLSLSREEVRARVRKAMAAVGLDFEEFKDRHTFGLSGGQMRRVAIAGVLALEPEVLVLDEPTAGLDPQGRHQLLAHLLALHQQGMTLVIISHNMEELAALCDRLYVLADGRTVLEGTPAEIFGQPARLQELGLGVPQVTAIINTLVAEKLLPADSVVYTVEQAMGLLCLSIEIKRPRDREIERSRD